MPKCYQLIGVPGAGKSTWIKNQPWAEDCVVASTDNLIEAYSESIGKTYNDVFDEYMPMAVKEMSNQVAAARRAGKDVIWDQTSTTVKSRKKKFNMLPDYEHVAVVFTTPDTNELIRRLANRPGKNIPTHVMRRMIDCFEMPTEDEGFAKIDVVVE